MVLGGFEQKETKRTKGRPTSLFPSLSSVDLGCVTRLGADFLFGVFRVFRGYIPTVLIPAQRERSCRPIWLRARGRRFLSDALWIAEPDRCTEPPFALGTGASEFWISDKSGLDGR